MRKNMKILTGLAILAVTAGAAIITYELFKKKFHTGCIYGGCHDENLDDIPESCRDNSDCIDYVDISTGEGIHREDKKNEECPCVDEPIEEPDISSPVINEGDSVENFETTQIIEEKTE
ncbi:MAG: hypothetical protein K0S55_991 [Clostridia bacterium]|nr:hypothetical protein [Clostridia bacterium]